MSHPDADPAIQVVGLELVELPVRSRSRAPERVYTMLHLRANSSATLDPSLVVSYGDVR
jgi:hypothetical protein